MILDCSFHPSLERQPGTLRKYSGQNRNHLTKWSGIIKYPFVYTAIFSSSLWLYQITNTIMKSEGVDLTLSGIVFKKRSRFYTFNIREKYDVSKIRRYWHFCIVWWKYIFLKLKRTFCWFLSDNSIVYLILCLESNTIPMFLCFSQRGSITYKSDSVHLYRCMKIRGHQYQSLQKRVIG